MAYVPRLVLAILVLIIGLLLIQWVINLTGKSYEKCEADSTLIPFLKLMLKAILTIMLQISVASMVGIKTISFIAVVGATALAVVFALQGSFVNFAGGVLILLLKPFKVGEYIAAQGIPAQHIRYFTPLLIRPKTKKLSFPMEVSRITQSLTTQPKILKGWILPLVLTNGTILIKANPY